MKYLDSTRSNLGELAGLAAITESTERRIMMQAESRLREVNASIDRLRSGIEAAPDSSQQRYLDLVAERGKLQIIIAKAQGALGY